MVNGFKHAHRANHLVSPPFSFLSFPEVYYLLSAPAPLPGILRSPPPSLSNTTKHKCTRHKDLDYRTIQPTTPFPFGGKTNLNKNLSNDLINKVVKWVDAMLHF